MKEMHMLLRATLDRLWAWVWPSHGRVVPGERKDRERVRDRDAARSRFWIDLREGQREAEARGARLRS
jgi:hypothetical protein